jgi:uncharacterized metal-binding protein
MAEEPIKVGIISCAGEEIPEGTISRLAVRRVLERLRPGQAVTLCLPLFLAGDSGEREFARNYPTITVDGCDKQCAKWGTEKYSGPVSAALVVTDLLRDAAPLSGAHSGRKLTDCDLAAVELVANKIVESLDRAAAEGFVPEEGAAAVSCGCDCSTPLPAGELLVDGERIIIAGLPLIFQQCREDGLPADSADLAQRLVEAVAVYHPVPASHQDAYGLALARAYEAYLRSSQT